MVHWLFPRTTFFLYSSSSHLTMPKIEFFMTRRYFGKTLIYGVTGSEINNQWSFQLFSLDIGQATTSKKKSFSIDPDKFGYTIFHFPSKISILTLNERHIWWSKKTKLSLPRHSILRRIDWKNKIPKWVYNKRFYCLSKKREQESKRSQSYLFVRNIFIFFQYQLWVYCKMLVRIYWWF